MAKINALDVGLPAVFEDKNVLQIVLDFLLHYQFMAWMQESDSALQHFLLQNMSPQFFLCNPKYCTLGACLFEKNEIRYLQRSDLNKIRLLDETQRDILINGSDECCLFVLQHQNCSQKLLAKLVPEISDERLELLIKHSPQPAHSAFLTAVCNHRLPIYAERMVHLYRLQRPTMDNVTQWPCEPEMVRYLLTTTPCLNKKHKLFLFSESSHFLNRKRDVMVAMYQALQESGKLTNDIRVLLFHHMVRINNLDWASWLYRVGDDMQHFFPSPTSSYLYTRHVDACGSSSYDNDSVEESDETPLMDNVDHWEHEFVHLSDDDVYDSLPIRRDTRYVMYCDALFDQVTDDRLERTFEYAQSDMDRTDVMFKNVDQLQTLSHSDPFGSAIHMQLQQFAQNDAVLLFQNLCRIGADSWAIFLWQHSQDKPMLAQTITPENGCQIRNRALLDIAIEHNRIHSENVRQWIFISLECPNMELWTFLHEHDLIPLSQLLQHDKKFIILLTRCKLPFLQLVWQETTEWAHAHDMLLRWALDIPNEEVLRFLLRAPFDVSQTFLLQTFPRFISAGIECVIPKLKQTLSYEKLLHCYFRALEQPRGVIEALWRNTPITLHASKRIDVAHHLKGTLLDTSHADFIDICIFSVEKHLVDISDLITTFGIRVLPVLAHFNCDFDDTPQQHWH